MKSTLIPAMQSDATEPDVIKLSADLSCTSSCPVARAASVIDGRWTTLIIRDLLPGKRRYSELLASLSGISPKVLAERLRFLEAQGLLTKTIYPVVPPKTEYELTPTGRKLEAVIQAMAAFGAGLPDPPQS